VRRHHSSGAVISSSRRPSLLGSPTGLLLLVAWIGILVVRLRTTSGPAILIALAIVLVVSAWFVVRFVRLSRQTRVFPLAGRGVEPLTGLSAMSRTGIGIVTKDAPIVVAGRDIHDDPAIVGLRQHLGDR
jgi:hypothetical protein